MRLVSYLPKGKPDAQTRIGALIDYDTRLVSFTDARPGEAAFSSMIGLMEAGEGALDQAREIHGEAISGKADFVILREQVKLLAPVPVPNSMRDWACFPEHTINVVRNIFRKKAAQEADPEAAFARFEKSGVLELPKDFYELPRFHSSNRMGIIGPEDSVEWPSFSNLMDFELEFGVYIGRKGKDIPLDAASPYIFGYTIFNDFTARDMQMRENRQGGLGKEFDTGSAQGPCLVTADEIGNPYDLKMEAKVNGEIWCSGTSKNMVHTFERLIAHMSQSTTLYPGDFLGSGTHGKGCGMEVDRFLNDGDVVELTVEKIGTLKTQINKTPVRRAAEAAAKAKQDA